MKKIQTPLTKEILSTLEVGEKILLSGVIYTGRDAAHKRLIKSLEDNKNAPFQLEGQLIYYVGPTPTPEGAIIGSAGPTTSYRMDEFTPTLLDKGILGTVGKGKRSDYVIESIKNNGAVYFAAVGGTAALMAECVKKCEVIAYEDLGTEAIRRLEVEDMPLIVAVSSKGEDYYKLGRKNYLEMKSR
ncbi:Fe-S-containing hydro-lyase [Anaeromicrobium sediminis]|uniref:Fumarate hydratase n=1 Tax=Anaeromicrobium sediminis TaxID=1478221 RepID=A0A267MMH5_9FIRM|nr:Fe-S-containing hydro-lyase [Anaeromicrobium sediminis]PAB60075.1 fumarate hydratase [Anaeromicrobium sediminis]